MTTKQGTKPENKAKNKAKKSDFRSKATKQKQSKAIKVVESNVKKTGKLDKGKAGMEAGYSPSYAKTGRWLKSDSFREKFDQVISDEKVINWHNQLGSAKKLDHMVFPISIDNEDIEELITSTGNVLRKISETQSGKHAWFWTYDARALKDAIDIAHKIKGTYAPIKVENDDAPFADLSDEELAEEIKQMKNFFLKKSPPKKTNNEKAD